MVMAAANSQFHVLAVDDSPVDRKLIERLLKTSSYQGKDENFDSLLIDENFDSLLMAILI
jgi:CheY-like chemotaxis protein